MKRKHILTLLLMILLLSSCSTKGRRTETQIWEEGYDAGYSDGKFDSDIAHDDDYANGYEKGYRDAASDYDLHRHGGMSDELSALFYDIELEARSYAGSDSDHDIESALDTVDAYLNGTATYWGEWPTKADFDEAVRYLYDYSNFYYNRRYAD